MGKNQEQRTNEDDEGVRQTCHKHVRHYGHRSNPIDAVVNKRGIACLS